MRYDVNKDYIRRANGFTGDEIFMKKELIIPFTSNLYLLIFFLDGPLYKLDASSIISEEVRKKE